MGEGEEEEEETEGEGVMGGVYETAAVMKFREEGGTGAGDSQRLQISSHGGFSSFGRLEQCPAMHVDSQLVEPRQC